MGTKSNELEESTMIRSSAEIDEMLRNAAAAQAPVDDLDAHTQIGNVSDLIARSAIPEPTPVVAPRASTNVIRRATTPHPLVRASAVMAVVKPQEPEPPRPAKVDDDAFDPWNDAPWDDAPEVQVKAAAPTVAKTEEPVAAPSVEEPVEEPLEEISADEMVEEPVVEPAAVPTPTPWLTMRLGVIAWVVLLLVTISVGTMSYLRIAALEAELATTRAQLNR